MPTPIETEAVRCLVDAGAQLVDVLPHELFLQEHIPGSINLPLAEVEERALRMLPDRDADIAAYCGKFT